MSNTEIRILLAEDDPNLGNILSSYLKAKGFPTTLCINGKEALDTYNQEQFDFLIIDVMMPVMDGFTMAKEVREGNKDIPILFLTAKSMQEDKLKGFQVGADDYLTKPFNMEELVARIQAILRRTDSGNARAADGVFTMGNFSYDYNRQILKIDDTEQKLTSKEAGLLKILCENANNVVDRSDALKEIWHDDSYFNARSMDVYIAKIRKYLKADPTVELINVHGVGFKLVTQ
jgi:DNA-binding response OmpR family regulator